MLKYKNDKTDYLLPKTTNFLVLVAEAPSAVVSFTLYKYIPVFCTEPLPYDTHGTTVIPLNADSLTERMASFLPLMSNISRSTVTCEPARS